MGVIALNPHRQRLQHLDDSFEQHDLRRTESNWGRLLRLGFLSGPRPPDPAPVLDCLSRLERHSIRCASRDAF